jgi:hypothetical protein
LPDALVADILEGMPTEGAANVVEELPESVGGRCSSRDADSGNLGSSCGNR